MEKIYCSKGHLIEGDNRKVRKSGQVSCRECDKASWHRFRANNPDAAYRGKVESQMRLRYGINSIEERDALLVAQGGACAACGRTDCKWGRGWLNVWHIDHKHGEVGTHRGILCARCNVVVGILETSSVLIQKCRDYLAKW